MTEHAPVSFTGGSETKYKFTAYSWDTNFTSVGGVYIITRREKGTDNGYSHVHIYIGQTGDLSERFDSHHKASCFSNHNANSICVFREDNEQRRLEIESDLLDKYSPPCND